MKPYFFITGTDTGIGKTYFSCQWLSSLKQQGVRTIALKPLATGGEPDEDALQLQQAASINLPYEMVNPFNFEPAIAPHLAAALNGQNLKASSIAEGCMPALSHQADLYLIEGAGGWLVPFNDHETWSDFVKIIGAKVILVVGMRLGCLNHALLSAAAIERSGCEFAGWVANVFDQDMPCLQENITCLQSRIRAPLLFRQRNFASGKCFDFTGLQFH